MFFLGRRQVRRWQADRHLENGRRMAQAGNLADALLEYDRALRRGLHNPAEIEARYQIASLYVGLGQFYRALQEYDNIARRWPGAALAEQSILMMGTIYEQWFARPDLAIQTYHRYLQEYPQGAFQKEVLRRMDRLSVGKRGG